MNQVKAPVQSKTFVQWSDVVRATQDDETRSWLILELRKAGFGPGEINTRREPRIALLDAMTATEDRLELQLAQEEDARTSRAIREAIGMHRQERLALREVRRRLELELFP